MASTRCGRGSTPTPPRSRASSQPRRRSSPARSPTRSNTKSSPAKLLNSRSGALAASIAAEISGDGEDVAATVGSFGDVKYAAIQEYGGKTGAHEILPSKASVLAFVADGAMHFARRVEHPGSLIPERSYLRSSLDEMRAEIVAALAAAASEGWEQT